MNPRQIFREDRGSKEAWTAGRVGTFIWDVAKRTGELHNLEALLVETRYRHFSALYNFDVFGEANLLCM